MNLWAWIKSVWAAWMDPMDVFDDDTFPDSDGWTDRTPLDADCPDTQPTAPGALDHDV
jgi:hypothetical protein